jgi:MFS family permease
VGVAAVLLSPRLLDESRGRREPVDLPGLGLVSAGLLGVVWATVRGNADGWLAASTLGAYAAGIVVLIAFVLWELRHPHPMLPLHFFRDARYSVSNGTGFLLHFAMFGAFLMAIQFLAEVRGESPLMAGVWTLPWTVMPLIVSPFSGRLGQRTNPTIPSAAGMALLGAGTLGLGLTLHGSTTPAAIAPALFLIGLGIGLVLPNIAALAMGSVPHADIGKASGTLSTARQLGSVFGVAVAVAILQASHPGGSPAATARGISHAFASASVAAFAGALLSLAIVPRFAALLASARRAQPSLAEPERP